MYKATIHNDGKILQHSFNKGEDVLSVLGEAGIYIDAPCGGNGRCGKCKVIVKGSTDTMQQAEERFISPEETKAGVRLACHCRSDGDVEIWVMSAGYEVHTSFGVLTAETSPAVDIKPTLSLHKKAVGMAVDIGTTTVAAFFYDLLTGNPIYTVSGVNAQKSYGADVMSRIQYCTEKKDGAKHLQNLIISQLNGMIGKFEKGTGISRLAVCDCVIAGNTTMELIAAGYGVESLGYAPYTPESLLGEYIPAKKLGLFIGGDAGVFFMPCPGGFLGGDAVAVMLSCEFDKPDKTAYMVDIGTNGEMAAVKNQRIFACSTAAGPALEGAQIKYGMGSIPGAVSRVKSDQNGRITAETIDNASAIGICGSGIVDSVAVMLKLSAIDETGRIDEDSPYTVLSEGERVFPIVNGIHLTQKDVREIQLAKSAICSGTKVLIEKSGIEKDSKGEIYVAGGFGSHLNLINAGYIGLLPDWMAKKAEAVGNAAGKGAVLALLSKKERQKALDMAEKIQIIELTGNPRFEQEFVENMMFE